MASHFSPLNSTKYQVPARCRRLLGCVSLPGFRATGLVWMSKLWNDQNTISAAVGRPSGVQTGLKHSAPVDLSMVLSQHQIACIYSFINIFLHLLQDINWSVNKSMVD